MTESMAAILAELIWNPVKCSTLTEQRREWLLDEHMRLRDVERNTRSIYAAKNRDELIKAIRELSKQLTYLEEFRNRRGLEYSTPTPQEPPT